MSTVHRILLIAFARSGHAVAGRSIAGRMRTGDGGGAILQSRGPDVLSCTPWAGLYVEGPYAS